jgi:Rod binding domain-containing protein
MATSMTPASIMPAPGGSAALLALSSATRPQAKPGHAFEAAQDFEAVFLNSMFSQMFTDVDGEGPFGGNQATGVWRSFLTEEYSKSFAKAGGLGLADSVYHSLLALQETK